MFFFGFGLCTGEIHEHAPPPPHTLNSIAEMATVQGPTLFLSLLLYV
jgi:hypothetical protein